MKKTLGFTRTDDTDKTDRCTDANIAEFYSPPELKSAGLFKNARTSRALGIIYSHPDVYAVYNFGDKLLKWENKTEESFLFRTVMMFSRTLKICPKLICVGNNSDIAEMILNSRGGNKKNFFKPDWRYNNIFFLDNSAFAAEQFKYFINGRLRKSVTDIIENEFDVIKKYEYYGETADKSIVVNCTVCNLSTLKTIKENNLEYGKNIKIICFHFQMPFLERYFGNGENIEYYEIDASKILCTEDTR